MNRTRALQAIFVGVTMLSLSVPAIGTLVLPPAENIENTSDTPLPKPIDDGSPNIDYLSDLGRYFETHYAFRNELVTADTLANLALFGTSSVHDVICGVDGWLYYAGTLGDYLGENQMSDYQVGLFAHNFSLVDDYVERCGGRLILLFPPNKNTVYPDEMPSRYLEGEGPHIVDRLSAPLRGQGVTYLDLPRAYREAAKADNAHTLYYPQDTHWNAYGSLLAYEMILEAAGRQPIPYGWEDLEWGEHRGDLQRMLLPLVPQVEWAPNNVIAQGCDEIGTETTENHVLLERFTGSGDGSLMMYRDSFGEVLERPLASNFASAVFYLDQDGKTYDLSDLRDNPADVVVIERAERFMPVLCGDMPHFPAPDIGEAEGLNVKAPVEMSDLSLETYGSLTKVSGRSTLPELQDSSAPPSDVHLRVRQASGEEVCFAPYIGMASIPGVIDFYLYLDGQSLEALLSPGSQLSLEASLSQ
ncbi:MAG: hypothetical protein HFJ75_06870 [Eggerthellaceae bacterium]|nr:hypothetical protein [Eggerthellaceae bacterium]